MADIAARGPVRRAALAQAIFAVISPRFISGVERQPLICLGPVWRVWRNW